MLCTVCRAIEKASARPSSGEAVSNVAARDLHQFGVGYAVHEIPFGHG